MSETKNIKELINQVLEIYLDTDHGYEPTNLYQIMVAEIEKPLFENIMVHTKGNLSKAAQILGLSRTTLRKKLHELSIK
ncbi:MAG: helix-turn-helix domain-containing protein [Pseudomonadota bacterium]|nr:helix-turn-helix domain-containing protein [Pseudomonadota bacterium]